MNHTIEGIIIVAAITSMLVLGLSMVPVMQNSFAQRTKPTDDGLIIKSADERQAESDTNTNTNTNSADSTSSSSATADNTNNITNSATASNSQEQSTCAVALICPEGSTTVTPPPCNPSTVGGITAIRTDDTCSATIFASAGREAVAVFIAECRRIPGEFSQNSPSSLTCTFPAT